MNADNPLREKDYKALNNALYTLNRVALKLEQAEAAGINVDEYKNVCDHFTDRCEKIKQTYFKGRP